MSAWGSGGGGGTPADSPSLMSSRGGGSSECSHGVPARWEVAESGGGGGGGPGAVAAESGGGGGIERADALGGGGLAANTWEEAWSIVARALASTSAETLAMGAALRLWPYSSCSGADRYFRWPPWTASPASACSPASGSVTRSMRERSWSLPSYATRLASSLGMAPRWGAPAAGGDVCPCPLGDAEASAPGPASR
jgi:hypothetical protein